MPLDYSKWKDIEVSDDEDETHPNIDTASLFRWRHQARMERMKQAELDRNEMEHSKKGVNSQTEEIDEKLSDAALSEENRSKLQERRDELARQQEEFLEKERQLAEKEELQPWNVDTIGRVGWSRSVINKGKNSDAAETESNTDDTVRFVEENLQLLERLQGVKTTGELEKVLLDHPHLSCDFTTTYLTMHALQLAIEEEWSELERVAKASIYLQYLYEFARGTNRLRKHADVETIRVFAKGFRDNTDLMSAFQAEVQEYMGRIRQRAREKVNEAEEEDKRQRIAESPGGLDPIEVLNSLPDDMRKAFEKRDKEMMTEVASTMEPELFSHHLQRCIDSGLWIP